MIAVPALGDAAQESGNTDRATATLLAEGPRSRLLGAIPNVRSNTLGRVSSPAVLAATGNAEDGAVERAALSAAGGSTSSSQ